MKNNLGRLDLPNLAYMIDEVFIDTDEGPATASTARLRWTGESDVGAEEVLARKPGQRDVSDNTEKVVAYVEERGCPLSVADIAEHFPAINRDTLRKALRRAAQRGELTNPLYGHYGPPVGTP